MPISLKEKYLFFHNLSVMYDSGMPFSRSLRVLAGDSSIGKMAVISAELHKHIEAGKSLTDAVKKFKVFKFFEIQLIKSAEKSGTLDLALKHIAAWLEHQLKMKQLFLSDLMFPVTVFHGAIFLAPAPAFIFGKITLAEYCSQTFGVLLTLYISLIAIYFISLWLLKIKPLRDFVSAVISHVPIVGKLLKKIDLYRFTFAFHLLYQSGIDIVQALKISQKPVILSSVSNAIDAAISSVKSGNTVSAGLESNSSIPLMMLNMWKTGEESGELSDMLVRIAGHFEDEIKSTISTITFWAPKIIYFGFIAYIIFVNLEMASRQI